jgi:enoyl-CoA hydratase/carnithine racemase
MYTVTAVSELVSVEKHDAVGVIRIDRPKVNALNVQVVSELNDACAQVESDSSIRAAVVYGGERIFSAGADLKEMSEGTPDDVRSRVGALQRLCDRMAALPVPVIAAITGFALGGGCELAMACDFRFVVNSARLGQPEIVVGLIPGAGGTQRLPRLVGPARAKWMIFTGAQVKAATALEWGLADEVVEGDVFERALEQAASYAAGPTVSLAAAKVAINRATSAELAAGLELELDEFTRLFHTQDTRHGIESFLAEGPGKATFTGR